MVTHLRSALVYQIAFVVYVVLLRPAECVEDDLFDILMDCDVDNATMEMLSLVDCEKQDGPPFICTIDIFFELFTIAHLLTEKKERLEKAFGEVTDFNELGDVFQVMGDLANAQTSVLKIIRSQNKTDSNAQYCYDEEELEESTELLSQLSDFGRAYGPWIRYYFPVIYGTEFTLGMLGNILVLIVLLRHKDMRTKPNVMIVNLAIGDILLVINATAICYFRFRWIFLDIDFSLCLSMVFMKNLATGVSVYSMSILSILRFIAVSSKVSHFLERQHVRLLVLCAWLLGGFCALLKTLNTNSSCEDDENSAMKYTSFVFLCLLPLLIVLVFSWLTTRVIKRNLQPVPGETNAGVASQRVARERSSKIIICFMIVYCVTYVPMSIYNLVESSFGYFNIGGNIHFNFVSQALLPVSSCLNPLALYIGSRNFRKHCKEYFCCSYFSKTYEALIRRSTTSTTPV